MHAPRLVVAVFTGLAMCACGGDTDDGTTVEASVGAAGGTITSADGRLTMTIPPDALADTATITIAPTDDPEAFHEGIGYAFSPEGLTFSRAVTVEVAHNLDLDDPATARFGRLQDDGTVVHESVLEAGVDELTAAIDGFSQHGVIDVSDPGDDPPNPVMQADGRTVHVYVRVANGFAEFAVNNDFNPPPSSAFRDLHIGRSTQLDALNRPYYVHALSGPAVMVWYRYPPSTPTTPVKVARVAYFGEPTAPVHPYVAGGGGIPGACPIAVELAGAVVPPGSDLPLNSTALVHVDTSACVPASATTIETRWFEATPSGVDELGNPIPAGRQPINTPDGTRQRYLEADGSLEIWVGYSLVLEAETWADGSLVDTSSVALNTIAPSIATQLRPDVNGRISTNQPFAIVVQRADNGEPVSNSHANDYATIEMELWSTVQDPLTFTPTRTTMFGSYSAMSPAASVPFQQSMSLPIGWYIVRARVLDAMGSVVSVPPPWNILITPP
ncbi:MAG: hypothetical protein WBG86_14675 [Polyangiales bacterium]